MDEQNKQLDPNRKGYLFPNKKKNKSSQPDYIGKVTWNNEEISISAWERTSNSGEKFLSISLSEKYVRPDEGNNSSGQQNKSSNTNSVNSNSNKSTQNIAGSDLQELDNLLFDE